MPDTNEIRFSGTIERLKSIQTRTGTSMATFLLKVGQDRFKVVAFKNIADAILKNSDGAQVSVTGSGSINSWKDNDDHWHNDFQLSAWDIEIHGGEKLSYEKAPDKEANRFNKQPEAQEAPPIDEFDYKGGPF